ncbi:TM1802 family CRISPR-associated protein [Halosimplex marinum]|uniref:TM1802 family CRISPR-associated protein n=1 Tax=Halosimplex marinum TaxID=3396620 RepID=UPI003F544FD9
MSGTFADRFEQYWGEMPVTSLRRVQALYGAITEARQSGESVVPEEFQIYVTPDELDGFTSDEGDGPKLVTVFVDLTGEPTLEDVDVTAARSEHVDRLGYSIYPWGRGIDHSITERGAKSGSSVSRTATYCVDCLERWTNADDREPAIGEVAAEHPDGWVIQALQTLGQRDGIEGEIEKRIEQQYSGGDLVIATVACRLDASELTQEPTGEPTDGYYYPGQLHVLNAGMRARNEEKLARKNLPDSSPPSRGEASCLVTGEADEVFGTTEDPLAFYTVQHAEKFPGLHKSESWRSHGVSSEAALLVKAGSALVDGFRTTRRGRGVYTIPYFTTMTPLRAKYLGETAEGSSIDTQAEMVDMQEDFERDIPDAVADLRFYVIVVRNDSGDINVLTEAPDLSIQPARALADAQRTVLDSSTFDTVAGFEHPDDWGVISENLEPGEIVRSIVGGRYAYGTLSIPDEDAPAADDPADWLTFALLGGEGVPVERLLSEYVARLVDDQRADEENRLPENQLKAQFAQLEALARAERLTTDERASNLEPLIQMPPHTQTADDLDDEIPPEDRAELEGEPRARYREYRLNRFLAERPALDPETNPTRSAAFLAGVFVGQIGYYQADTRDMNRTALQQYPTEQMTGRRIDRLVPELVDKANAYAMENEHKGASLFPELEDLLSTTLTAVNGDWDIGTDDLRFHYALGQLYGKRAGYRAYQLKQRLEQDVATEAADSDQ